MTASARRSSRRLAQSFEDYSPAHREAALLMQRSFTGIEFLASLASEDMDIAEIVRIAQSALDGRPHAQKVFVTLNHTALCSLGRVLCIAGDDRAFDGGLTVLRATARFFGLSKLGKSYRGVLDAALLYRGYFEEAAYYVKSPDFDPAQLSRFKTALHNPFRSGNPQAVSVPEWLEVFNSFASPSGDLTPITLNSDLGGLPFDQLWSTPRHHVDGPLVTVVMSSFRRDKTIIGAIQSILNQTWKSLELLVIDDNSGAEYDDLYENIAELDPRIRVVRQRINGGTYLIRNRALTLARGDFMTFQDSDDWSHPERIEQQMRPLLDNASIVATQSSCFRTDDFLDPVQVGYPKYLRRNESSLLFRTRTVQRVGFFHYTRKGGDSEYRRRIEAEYGRPTPVVGDEALAVVRLTPGSLSRNEFAPGFRHPRRLIYSQGFSLLHERSRSEDTLYRPLREYSDPIVPAKFEPRHVDTTAKVFDVIVVADIRVCAEMEEWIVSTVEKFHARGLRIGLAHYVGLRVSNSRFNSVASEVTRLYVDELAESVDFGDLRRTTSVLVADSTLLQHLPWDAQPWKVRQAYVRPPVQSEPVSDSYDDVTVGYNCRRLFGVGPTWMRDDGEPAAIDDICQLARKWGSACGPDTATSSFMYVESRASDLKKDGSGSGDWKCVVELETHPAKDSPVEDILTTSRPLPTTIAQDGDTGQWCAVVGWPIVGYDLPHTQRCVAEVLLRAWMCGESEFNQRYSDLGGDCIVIRGVDGDIALRSTVQDIAVEKRDGHAIVHVADPGAHETMLAGNCDELVLTSLGTTHCNPIDANFDFDGVALEEFQLLVNREADAAIQTRPLLVLEDNLGSALWVGLFRSCIDQFDIRVCSEGTKIAFFLDSHFAEYTLDLSARLTPCPLAIAESGAAQLLSPLAHFGASMRGRRLASLVRKTINEAQIVEALWPGLSSILNRGSSPPPGGAPRRMSDVKRQPVPLALNVQDANDIEELEFREKHAVRLGVAPDLAFSEQFPLSGTIVPGATHRLVVTLAAGREDCGDGYPKPTPMPESSPDHHLVIADTTFAGVESLEFGWFFGAPGDKILRRWGSLIKKLNSRLKCTETVVCGEGRAALAAVVLASYLPRSTVLVSGLEAEAGDADSVQFTRLTRLIGNASSPDDLVASYQDRLCLRAILRDAPSKMKLVLMGDSIMKNAGTGYIEARSDPRTRVEPLKIAEWLRINSVSNK